VITAELAAAKDVDERVRAALTEDFEEFRRFQEDQKVAEDEQSTQWSFFETTDLMLTPSGIFSAQVRIQALRTSSDALRHALSTPGDFSSALEVMKRQEEVLQRLRQSEVAKADAESASAE
jgi:hypothetical protein